MLHLLLHGKYFRIDFLRWVHEGRHELVVRQRDSLHFLLILVHKRVYFGEERGAHGLDCEHLVLEAVVELLAHAREALGQLVECAAQVGRLTFETARNMLKLRVNDVRQLVLELFQLFLQQRYGLVDLFLGIILFVEKFIEAFRYLLLNVDSILRRFLGLSLTNPMQLFSVFFVRLQGVVD